MSDLSTNLVAAQDITKSFGDNHVLRGLSFTVPSGSATTVVGPSGSGKTTLLRSLNALDVPDSGVVSVGGVTIDFGNLSQKPYSPTTGHKAAWCSSRTISFPTRRCCRMSSKGR